MPMPRQNARPHADPNHQPTKTIISILCPDEVFQKHLTICINSDFTLQDDPIYRHVMIKDESNLVLTALPTADSAWLVNLNPDYYTHPFLEVR